MKKKTKKVAPPASGAATATKADETKVVGKNSPRNGDESFADDSFVNDRGSC